MSVLHVDGAATVGCVVVGKCTVGNINLGGCFVGARVNCDSTTVGADVVYKRRIGDACINTIIDTDYTTTITTF